MSSPLTSFHGHDSFRIRRSFGVGALLPSTLSVLCVVPVAAPCWFLLLILSSLHRRCPCISSPHKWALSTPVLLSLYC